MAASFALLIPATYNLQSPNSQLLTNFYLSLDTPRAVRRMLCPALITTHGGWNEVQTTSVLGGNTRFRLVLTLGLAVVLPALLSFT